MGTIGTLEVGADSLTTILGKQTVTNTDVAGRLSLAGGTNVVTFTNAIKARSGCTLDLQNPAASLAGIQLQECRLEDIEILSLPGQTLSITGT